MSKPVLQVVVSSVRPSRVSPIVAEWFAEEARKHGAFEVEVTDLAELNLPLMDEPNHPIMQAYQHEHTKRWANIVERSDAFVFVVPEYDHGYPAPLKNAIDYLFKEWAYKPVSFVSYGGISAGLRAVQQLKPVLSALKMVPITEQVMIPMIGAHIVDGKFAPNEIIAGSVAPALDELAKMERALASLR
ncbi:NADPH-dependent FMN reductase [Actinomyces urinae]|uniref:NADPH-dependent FMN reductase n=1 Tax=Actinomyces urinae TaxID=1689268 RepID=UPI00093010AD|nr:NAD(P)H-dependent oxidoreductase [Actinomyces urinae]